MSQLFHKSTSLLARIPTDFIAMVARVSVSTVFLRSGMLKLDGWNDGTTLALFTDEYKLPFIAPKGGRLPGDDGGIDASAFCSCGFMTRYAALSLLCMTLVIEVFVYPDAFDTHGVWAVSLLFLMKYGAGTLSVDALAFGDRALLRT